MPGILLELRWTFAACFVDPPSHLKIGIHPEFLNWYDFFLLSLQISTVRNFKKTTCNQLVVIWLDCWLRLNGTLVTVNLVVKLLCTEGPLLTLFFETLEKELCKQKTV